MNMQRRPLKVERSDDVCWIPKSSETKGISIIMVILVAGIFGGAVIGYFVKPTEIQYVDHNIDHYINQTVTETITNTVYQNTYINPERAMVNFSVNMSYPIFGVSSSPSIANITSISAFFVMMNETIYDVIVTNGWWGEMGGNLTAIDVVAFSNILNNTYPSSTNWTFNEGYAVIMANIDYNVHWSNGSDVNYQTSFFNYPSIISDGSTLGFEYPNPLRVTFGGVHYDSGTSDIDYVRYNINGAEYIFPVELNM